MVSPQQTLSQPARELMTVGRLFVSPMVALAFQSLHELKKITNPPETILLTLSTDLDLQISDLPFSQIVQQAKTLSWTRDPFDRLIVAKVMLIESAQLITGDRAIREHCKKAVW